MSDEQTPPAPALRLKPRLKPAEGETPSAAAAGGSAAPVPPPAAATPVAADSGDQKVRLKPRITLAPPEAAAAPAEPAPAAEIPVALARPPEPPPAALAPEAAPGAPAPSGPPRVQLKPRVNPAPPAAAGTSAPAPEAVAPPPPPAVAAPAPAAAPAAEPGKFKFKPKIPGAPPPAGGAPPGAAPPPPPPPAAGKPQTNSPMPPPPPPPGVGAPKPPPFPVVAPPKSGTTAPPIPHINAATEPSMPVQEPAFRAPKGDPLWKNKKILIGGGVAALVVLAAGAWFVFRPKAPPPLPPKATKVAVAPPAPAAANPASPKAGAPTGPGPALSETQSAIAHAPVNAINKARDVAAKRVGSGQGRDAISEITDDDPSTAKAAAKAPAAPVTTSSNIAPGVSATNDNITAMSEASPPFRSFVANAKITGVFQGTPPRIMLNGRLVRGGESVDSNLAISFDSVDTEKKLLVFKDKTGATVSRRY